MSRKYRPLPRLHSDLKRRLFGDPEIDTVLASGSIKRLIDEMPSVPDTRIPGLAGQSAELRPPSRDVTPRTSEPKVVKMRKSKQAPPVQRSAATKYQRGDGSLVEDLPEPPAMPSSARPKSLYSAPKKRPSGNERSPKRPVSMPPQVHAVMHSSFARHDSDDPKAVYERKGNSDPTSGMKIYEPIDALDPDMARDDRVSEPTFVDMDGVPIDPRMSEKIDTAVEIPVRGY